MKDTQRIVLSLISTLLLMALCGLPARAEDASTPAVSPSPAKFNAAGTPAPRDEQRLAEKEKETSLKELEISKKELDIEKQKAELEGKEAELAGKEARVMQETARSLEEIKSALGKLRKEQAEATAAREKVTIAEERFIAAEEKARLAAEVLTLASEKAVIAEERLKEGHTATMRKAYTTLIIIGVGYLILFILVSSINRGIKELKTRHLLRKSTIYLVNIVMFVYIFFMWVQSLHSITIFLGVASAGIALALQEVILCIAGWVYVIFRRPFDVGERIELGKVKGDVIDIRLFQTVLLEVGNWVEEEQSTGRIVAVPNSMVFKGETYNYTRGFEYIWNEIKIVVTFESDWKRAEEIMRGHAREYCEGMERLVRRKLSAMTRRYMIFYDNLTPIVYANIKDSGVQLTLRYLSEARSRRITQDALSRRILDDFEKEPGVNFAYTTYRIVK